MTRRAIPTWTFSLVVVRCADQFLLVQEGEDHGRQWYLPAGRVEPGETLTSAAVRETLEETGVQVRLEGILRIEHTPMPDGAARMRVIFVAQPADPARCEPRTTPNEHTQGARWVTLEELGELPLRGREVRDVLEFVSRRGHAPFPLELITPEGAPWQSRAA